MLTAQAPGVTLEATVHGRAGELIQVRPESKKRIIVSGPVSSGFLTSLQSGNRGIVFPDFEDWKSQRAVDLFFEKVLDGSGSTDSISNTFHYSSTIPRGKGFSSSSADILALLLFLDRYYRTNLSISHIYSIAASIEPTDPLLHSGTVVFDTGDGSIIEELPPLPMTAFYFDTDPNATFMTPYSDDLPVDTAGHAVIDRFIAAWKNDDYGEIFRLTTESAVKNYSWNPRPGVMQLAHLAKVLGFGVFVAHTGTLLGVICENNTAHEVRALLTDFLKPSAGQLIFSEQFA